MKKTVLSAAFIFAALSVTCMAQDDFADINTRAGWGNGTILPGSGDVSFSFKNPGMFQAKNMIQIKEGAKYSFSGEIRKNPAAPTGPFYPGFVLYDKDKKVINGVHVVVIPGTATAIAKAAKAGDTEITIKSGARWIAKPYYRAALNAGPLPHRELSSGIKAVKRIGNTWKVTFYKPLTKNYPAGTKVRIQGEGSYFYVGSINKPADDWKAFGKNFVVSGVSKDRVEKGKFWPGTVYIRPFVQANWNWQSPKRNKMEIAVRNVKAGIVK